MFKNKFRECEMNYVTGETFMGWKRNMQKAINGKSTLMVEGKQWNIVRHIGRLNVRASKLRRQINYSIVKLFISSHDKI